MSDWREEKREKEKERCRLDDLFNIALVVVTVLGGAEFGFVAVISSFSEDIKTIRYSF